MTLWDFAVARYARPEVEAACLELQDLHGQCVPLLIWRLWSLARAADAPTLAAAVATALAWNEAATTPLRNVRRGLKRPVEAVPDAARMALREAVKAAERDAERILLDSLEALTPAAGAPAIDPLAALAELVATWPVSAPASLLRRLAVAAL